jgi:hypothetical protein
VIVASAILAATLQAAVAAGPRKDYVACLKTAETQAATQKVAPDAFAAFAEQNCSGIAQGFKSELVKFLVKNGLSRKAADEDAQLQIEDYIFTAEQRYRDKIEHDKPQ